MSAFVRVVVALWLVTGFASVACAQQPSQAAQPVAPTQPAPQGEFLPLDQLPPQDQLPAAPLLVAAYSLVVVALFVYLVSVARKLTAVKQDIERLESDVRRSGRA